jgi:hypothetical protein
VPASSQAYLDEAIAAATLMTDLPALADPAWISPGQRHARSAMRAVPRLDATRAHNEAHTTPKHALALSAPSAAALAERTSLSNTFVCQPQQRNMHGRIFGGFLMRRAFELAFATTYLFAGSRPGLVRVDEVTFRCAVNMRPHDRACRARLASHTSVHVRACLRTPQVPS